MVISVSAIGIGAPFSVKIVRNVVRVEPLESSGSRSTAGALLFTASTWTSAVAMLLLMMPSLTTISMVRVTFEGSMLSLLNLICCSASLIVAGERDARERDDTCARAGHRDAGRRCSVEGQNVAGLRVGQRDRGRGEVGTVAVDDQNVGIHDGDRRRRPR